MNTILSKYKEDKESAKAYYYLKKLEMDVSSEEGESERRKMLRCYLYGLQWVLSYYYKGCQHWGFYYNYHYPPMISDMMKVDDLLAEDKISNFDDWGYVDWIYTPY